MAAMRKPHRNNKSAGERLQWAGCNGIACSIVWVSNVSAYGSKWRHLLRECLWLIVTTKEWDMRQVKVSLKPDPHVD